MLQKNNPIIRNFLAGICFVGLYFAGGFCLAQDEPGNEDLEKAFDAKITAQSTRDLEGVVKLCKSAIEKGLDEEGIAQARQLAGTACMEHAEQLVKRIFQQTPPDPRWQKFRTEAMTQLNRAVEFQPEMINAYLLMARLNVELPNGNKELARSSIDKAIENSTEDSAQLSKAFLYRARMTEDKEAKLADVTKAIETDAKNYDALRMRAVLYFNDKETEKGTADINRWLEKEDATPNDLLEMVALLRSLGENFTEELQKEALKIIDRGAAMAPEDLKFNELRIQIYAAQKEYDKAIAEVTKLIEADSEKDEDERNYGLHLMRAGLNAEQEKFEEAIKDHDLVLEYDPDNVLAIQGKGGILAAKGDFSGALKMFKRLQRRMQSPNPGLMRQIAMLHNANDEPSKALKIYDELLTILNEDNFPGGTEEVRQGLELERQATWRGRADSYLNLGEHKKAIEDYDRVLKIQDKLREKANKDGGEKVAEDEHSLNNLAWALATSPIDELRDGKRAVELATRAAETTEFKEAYILSTLASGYAETGDFENAMKWVDKAVELNKEDRAKKETERNLEQKESLHKERESYLKKEPWRELNNVEKEKAEKEKAEKEKGDKDSETNREAESKSGEEKKDSAEDKNEDGKDGDDGNQARTVN